jgi:hypothetical protein
MRQLAIAAPVGVGCTNNRSDMTVVLELASDEEMQIISSWVRRKHAHKIVLAAP